MISNCIFFVIKNLENGTIKIEDTVVGDTTHEVLLFLEAWVNLLNFVLDAYLVFLHFIQNEQMKENQFEKLFVRISSLTEISLSHIFFR
ncbi:hypothetical protein MHK_001512 [Candidatus Magnetomorum sp. HK-1]|nr:hypothetical protein MHK_001512 [Candidatus Magnetomorum sp. HK-1]